ncbi:hypothetical protein Tco_1284811 [Tanacetum coccineum]
MDASKCGTIPMQPNVDLSKTQGPSTPAEVMRMKRVPYALAVGSIMYAVRCTRPDITFSHNLKSRYQQNLGESHWTAVKNILKYLRSAVDWKSFKQSPTIMSSMEIEYVYSSKASIEAIWIVIQEGDIRIHKVHTDNNLADPFTKPMSCTKHVELARNIGLRPAGSFM